MPLNHAFAQIKYNKLAQILIQDADKLCIAAPQQMLIIRESRQMFGRTVTVKIKYADFRQATRSQSLSAQITSAAVLRQVSLDLVRTVFPSAQGVRLVGMAVSNFGDIDCLAR